MAYTLIGKNTLIPRITCKARRRKMVKAEDSNSPFMMSITQVSMNTVSIPAVTHVDNTARIQTVTETSNIQLYRLLKAFEKYSGIPILLNTSFNVMGEPIVCTPIDAIKTFKASGIDILVINNYIIKK